MSKAADAGDPLGQNHRMGKRAPLEALLHAAMLEEELRMEMEDVLADVEEDQLRRFDHVGAHRPERQSLHVGAVDLRKAALGRLERHMPHRPGRPDRAAARPAARPGGARDDAARDGRSNSTPNRSVISRSYQPRSGLIAATLGTGPRGTHRHMKKSSAAGAACEIAQLELAGWRVPGIGHLHAAAAADQLGDRRRQIRRARLPTISTPARRYLPSRRSWHARRQRWRNRRSDNSRCPPATTGPAPGAARAPATSARRTSALTLPAGGAAIAAAGRNTCGGNGSGSR